MTAAMTKRTVRNVHGVLVLLGYVDGQVWQ
jgi:hypothetical protein